jgi:hypothetical protein
MSNFFSNALTELLARSDAQEERIRILEGVLTMVIDTEKEVGETGCLTEEVVAVVKRKYRYFRTYSRLSTNTKMSMMEEYIASLQGIYNFSDNDLAQIVEE